MKKVKFESNNKQWLVVDENLFLTNINGVFSAYKNDSLKDHLFNYKRYFKLFYITEEQASEVVTRSTHTGLFAHYVEDIPVNTYCYKSSIESLHSLLKSKGVDDTWINPLIFEIVK